MSDNNANAEYYNSQTSYQPTQTVIVTPRYDNYNDEEQDESEQDDYEHDDDNILSNYSKTTPSNNNNNNLNML